MALIDRVTVTAKHCDMIGQDVEFREERVYPSADFLRTHGNAYWVKSCGCTAAIRCNMAGIPCRWALNNPDSDRF